MSSKKQKFSGGARKRGIIMWTEDEVTFDDEESFQTFRVVVFKHLEDLAAHRVTQW